MNTCRIPGDFLTYMCIEFEFARQEKLSRICIGICYKIYSVKRTVCVYLIQIDGAQTCSRMCMCIEFKIRVLKRKSGWLRKRKPELWKKGKDPHPQDKIQHLDFTKDPRPLYYKTPPCAFYHKNVRSKAVFGP